MGDSRSGGELLGVVAADETADSPGCEDDDDPADDADDADWRREKENLKLGRRYVGKTGLVAEMRLSRGILGQRRAAAEGMVPCVLYARYDSVGQREAHALLARQFNGS